MYRYESGRRRGTGRNSARSDSRLQNSARNCSVAGGAVIRSYGDWRYAFKYTAAC